MKTIPWCRIAWELNLHSILIKVNWYISSTWTYFVIFYFILRFHIHSVALLLRNKSLSGLPLIAQMTATHIGSGSGLVQHRRRIFATDRCLTDVDTKAIRGLLSNIDQLNRQGRFCKNAISKWICAQSPTPWWRHQMETFSALLALCAGIISVTGEFPAQRQVTLSFDVFFDLRLDKRLSKRSWGWWLEMPLCPLRCHCNAARNYIHML